MAPRGPVPYWDGRVLRFLDLVIKEFKQPAWAQKWLLDGFQKPDWPPLVGNPFVGEPYQALSRLENAIKKLNSGHGHKGLLKFQLARGGDAAVWKDIAHEAEPERNSAALDEIQADFQAKGILPVTAGARRFLHEVRTSREQAN
jgi:hypothetical protein